MAAEHTPGARDKRSDIGISLLPLLIVLIILLFLNTVLVIILLNRYRSFNIERLPFSTTQPTQPTRVPLVAVVGTVPFDSPEPTLAPTYTLQATEAFSEVPMIEDTLTPLVPTSTSFLMTETPLPTATPLPPTGTPLPTTTPNHVNTKDISPIEPGWQGAYYANLFLAGNPVLKKQETNLDFNWGYSAPAVGIPADKFSARWDRTLYLDAGVYQFYVHADDGVRLCVDNLLLINEWHGVLDMTYSGQVTLRSGEHKIKVEYYEDEGTAEIQFWWEGPGTYQDWRGEYWTNQNLSGDPFLVRNDESIDFNWGRYSPDDDLPRDEFSARWSRLETFEEGTYRFQATVDDGLRLFIDNEMVLYEWHNSGVRDISVTRQITSGTHYIRIEYYEYRGIATIHFWWEKESNV